MKLKIHCIIDSNGKIVGIVKNGENGKKLKNGIIKLTKIKLSELNAYDIYDNCGNLISMQGK